MSVNNHEVELLLDFLKMPYTQENGPLLLNLVWDKFLGQKQKLTTFFAKTSQESVSSPAANIVPLQNLLSWASTVYITLKTTVFQTPTRM